ncbi:SurA N-terminal domain-containing protein [Nocardioides renjunii]|uniref:SurA N-terminal domain-containing protein n=1 Tax=Nocardioides renjunii TaxID=3095075 RepID=UPI002AFEBDE8|nr:SurA N-terminal domain-containing protein [Nocardioides sp. S-34]WQQ22800.1 SurA N-terminal domain-containing protein [Nocardioides sp. S-34]
MTSTTSKTISMMRTSRTRTALVGLAAAALLSLSACGSENDSRDEPDAAPSASESPSASADDTAAAGPDLEGIPDVVAEVNGEEVTKEEFAPLYEAAFQRATMEAQMSGAAPDEDALRKQTVDDLVDTELLAQEADERGLSVTDADVDAELEQLAQQNQMASGEELLKAIEEQGMSQEQARTQVGTQVMIEQLVADEGGPAEPTGKELREIYAQAKQAQTGQEIPPFAEVREQIAEQAKAEETGRIAQELVDGLREDADITVNL